jgi:hypothetical protein
MPPAVPTYTAGSIMFGKHYLGLADSHRLPVCAISSAARRSVVTSCRIPSCRPPHLQDHRCILQQQLRGDLQVELEGPAQRRSMASTVLSYMLQDRLPQGGTCSASPCECSQSGTTRTRHWSGCTARDPSRGLELHPPPCCTQVGLRGGVDRVHKHARHGGVSWRGRGRQPVRQAATSTAVSASVFSPSEPSRC